MTKADVWLAKVWLWMTERRYNQYQDAKNHYNEAVKRLTTEEFFEGGLPNGYVNKEWLAKQNNRR